MKKLLIILCCILTIYCIYFPISYFGKNADKKEITISHILVNTEEEAQNIKKLIDEEEITFEKAAQDYSLCPTGKNKGYIGIYDRGNLLPELEKEAFKIDKNILSKPIKTKEGWHLIKVSDITYFSAKENFKK